MRRLIVCADDFGLDPAVNEAVEIAHRDGILTCASLMVAGPAAADAVARARRLPGLAVGLHVVLVGGAAILPPDDVDALVGADGRFGSDMARAGVRAFFLPRVRAQIAREIRAQFAAFDATGLTLDHVNAHRHFHLHPTIAALIVEAGRAHGLRAMRVPAEPAVAGIAHGIGDRLLGLWSGRLRRHLRRAGIATNDHVFGLKWSGAMTAERTRRIVDALPHGVSEIYFHPATRRTSALAAEAPGYDYEGEFAALTDAGVKQAVADRGIVLVRYGDLVSPA